MCYVGNKFTSNLHFHPVYLTVIFENFELIANENVWKDETKLVYLPLYSKGSAYRLHKIMDSNTKLSFENIMLKFKEIFAS